MQEGESEQHVFLFFFDYEHEYYHLSLIPTHLDFFFIFKRALERTVGPRVFLGFIL